VGDLWSPGAHLVVVKAGFVLAGLEAFLHRSAGARDLDQSGQRHRLRCVAVGAEYSSALVRAVDKVLGMHGVGRPM
jgi:hypothetical protein